MVGYSRNHVANSFRSPPAEPSAHGSSTLNFETGGNVANVKFLLFQREVEAAQGGVERAEAVFVDGGEHLHD